MGNIKFFCAVKKSPVKFKWMRSKYLILKVTTSFVKSVLKYTILLVINHTIYYVIQQYIFWQIRFPIHILHATECEIGKIIIIQAIHEINHHYKFKDLTPAGSKHIGTTLKTFNYFFRSLKLKFLKTPFYLLLWYFTIILEHFILFSVSGID